MSLMNKFNLIKKLEDMAPIDTQESWDCCGWAVCTKKVEISKILLALTVCDNVISQAREKGCDMIISHHPLFFVPIDYSDIDIYCAHTNMDKAIGGTTDTLINSLGFNISYSENDFVRIVELNEPMRVEDFKNTLKNISPNLRYVNNKNRKTLSTIAFCAGSGSEFINDTKADAFVTGDLKFHTALDTNKIVFDIGHFESEISILKVFEKILDVDVEYAYEKSPFIY